MAKGNLAYCDLCPAFPCQKYRDLDVYDSFITHRNRWKDFARAREIGTDAYCAEQMQKVNCLQTLLANYNDGRKKRYFCLAVNLLPWQEVCAIVDELQARPGLHDLPSKERAAQAVQVFELAAQRYGVELKLRRKKTSKQNGD